MCTICEVLTVVFIKIPFLWSITPCGELYCCKCFGGACCLHIWGSARNVVREVKMEATRSTELFFLTHVRPQKAGIITCISGFSSENIKPFALQSSSLFPNYLRLTLIFPRQICPCSSWRLVLQNSRSVLLYIHRNNTHPFQVNLHRGCCNIKMRNFWSSNVKWHIGTNSMWYL